MKLNELKETITNITDPRRVSYGNTRHKLDDIIIIGLCTVICGGEDDNDMEAFGLKRGNGCVHFWSFPMEYRTAIPSDGCLNDPAELSDCLYDWKSNVKSVR